MSSRTRSRPATPCAWQPPHSLKSMSLNLGAGAVARRCAEIEGRARAEGELPSGEAVTEVARLLDGTMDALRTHFALAAQAEAA